MARPDERDTSRRDFFRTFGRETVRQAGAVAGAAAELRRSSMAAARVLFDPEAAIDSPALDPIDPPVVAVDPTQPDATFRSAYRFTGTQITALDARQLPGRVRTVALVEPSEVASAVRAGALNGGPVLAEVGAYAMALAARAVIARPETGRVQQLRAAANTLRAAKPGIHALTWAVDRLEALYLELEDQGADPAQVAESLQSEADAIALGNASAHAQIGRIGAQAVSAGESEPTNLLMHADMGPLSCGMVGMGTTLIQELRDAGRAVHVWLTDAAPGGEGGRVAAFQLRQLDVPFTVIPDAAVGWLLDRHNVAALLLRGDRVATNADCGVIVGGLSAAIVAAAADVPVIVLAPRNSFDPGAADGVALRADETFAPGAARLNPSSDVVPHDLVTRLISEAG
jgi:methylthioribose-1-phosphate isomerase